MSKRQTRHSPQKKLKISLEFLSGNHSTAELCKRYSIAKSTIHKWSQELKERGVLAFESNSQSHNPLLSKLEKLESELEQTRSKLGQVMVENEVLKKTCSKLEGLEE